MDFEDVVLQQPLNTITALADGKCGGNGDSLTVTTSTTTMIGFESLCGTLSGQHSNIL